MNMNSRGYHLWSLFNKITKEVKRTEHRSQSEVDNDNEMMRQNGDSEWVWVLDDASWMALY